MELTEHRSGYTDWEPASGHLQGQRSYCAHQQAGQMTAPCQNRPSATNPLTAHGPSTNESTVEYMLRVAPSEPLPRLSSVFSRSAISQRTTVRTVCPSTLRAGRKVRHFIGRGSLFHWSDSTQICRRLPGSLPARGRGAGRYVILIFLQSWRAAIIRLSQSRSRWSARPQCSRVTVLGSTPISTQTRRCEIW